MAHVLVVMGVSGCGKSSVGKALAEALGCPFYDGDDFHPPENVAKMAAGQPLNDQDRAPWLARLRDLLHGHIAAGTSAVLASSALKRRYRDTLREGNPGLVFVHLAGEFDLIYARMQARQGHYMGAAMLRSQFEALEAPDPDEALTLSIEAPVPQIVAQVLDHLGAERDQQR